jgi:hypothetical protein
MSILTRYAGFEELELNGGTLPVEAVEVGAEDSVRAEVAEVAVTLEQVSQEIEELREEVKQQDEAVEEIQEVVEGLESLINSGSFNSTAFANMYNRAAKLNTKLGGQSIERCGVESMSDAATAQIMARNGMEGFMETVKGYAKKAIEVIKHIFNTVINFFVGVFSQIEKLVRRQEQLSTRLAAADKLKEKVKLGGWNAMFDYEKHGLKAGMDGWDATGTALDKFAEVASKPTSIEVGKFNTAYAALTSAIAADAKKDLEAGEKSEGDKKVLIGQYAGLRVHAEMKSGAAKDLGEAAEMARSIKIFFGQGDVKKLTSGESAPKADKGELSRILTSIKSDITAFRGNKTAQAFSKAQRDQVIGTLNVVKADDKEKADEVNKQVALVRAIYATSASVTQQTHKYMLRCASWTLDAVAAHI